MTNDLWTGHREDEFHGIVAVTRDDATRAALFDADRMEWLRFSNGKLVPVASGAEAETVFEGIEYDDLYPDLWDLWNVKTHIAATNRGYRLGAWLDDGDELVAQVLNLGEEDIVRWFR